ncbi:Hypothetical protein, putative, partial [Bodo saltans]
MRSWKQAASPTVSLCMCSTLPSSAGRVRTSQKRHKRCKLCNNKKINRRIYHFLVETIVDPVPQLETTDELLRKPYEPRSKDPEPVALPPIARTAAGASGPGGTAAPASAKPGVAAAVESSDSDDDAPSGRTRGGKAKPPKKRRTQEGPEEHQSSKFDVFFRTVALYRD